jgi:hypothetical protein
MIVKQLRVDFRIVISSSYPLETAPILSIADVRTRTRATYVYLPLWFFDPPRTLVTFATDAHSSLLFFFHLSSRKSFSSPSWRLNLGLPILLYFLPYRPRMFLLCLVFEGILPDQKRRNAIS